MSFHEIDDKTKHEEVILPVVDERTIDQIVHDKHSQSMHSKKLPTVTESEISMYNKSDQSRLLSSTSSDISQDEGKQSRSPSDTDKFSDEPKQLNTSSEEISIEIQREEIFDSSLSNQIEEINPMVIISSMTSHDDHDDNNMKQSYSFPLEDTNQRSSHDPLLSDIEGNY